MQAIEPDTSDKLIKFIAEYKSTGRPVDVDFRNLVYWLPNEDSAIHYLHPYPAKLLMHIPRFFLANKMLSRPDDLIFDPFCGSGTVLVEAMLTRRVATGCDINPLATLITEVKTTPLPRTALRDATRRLVARAETVVSPLIPEIVNCNYWYFPSISRELARLQNAIAKVRNDCYRNFFLLCLSATARRLSRADPRISVPVRLHRNPYAVGHSLHIKTEKWMRHQKRRKPLIDFLETVETAIEKIGNLPNIVTKTKLPVVFNADARDESTVFGKRCDRIVPGTAALVITSPPYPGAQKYIRASSLNLGWLGYGAGDRLRSYERSSVGREKHPVSNYRSLTSTGLKRADILLKNIHTINPLRACTVATYLNEMRLVLGVINKSLKPGGHAVIVLGNSHVCGVPFDTQSFVTRLAEETGLQTVLRLVDNIRGRGLMTKRNRRVSPMTHEWVLVFRRG
jgi:hypothetical protein